MEFGFGTMVEYLPMVDDNTHIDFGSVPNNGLSRPDFQFWPFWVVKINFFVFGGKILIFYHKVYLCIWGSLEKEFFQNSKIDKNSFSKTWFSLFFQKCETYLEFFQKIWYHWNPLILSYLHEKYKSRTHKLI